MRYIPFLLSIALLIFGLNQGLTVSDAQAQTKPQTNQSDQPVEESEADQNNEPEQENRKPSSPDEVFIPSEELSEDLPAPFPVDI